MEVFDSASTRDCLNAVEDDFRAFYKIPENLIEITASKGFILLFMSALCRIRL
jgi:hypothetical protein